MEGWRSGADFIFMCKTISTNCPDGMDAEHYMEQFTWQLLPNLLPYFVIIINSATSTTNTQG